MVIPTLLAREIVEFSDAELDRYLEENGRVVDVHDPKNLPESFIQRLRDRVSSDTSRSRPVDLGQVSARLEQIAPDSRVAFTRLEDSSSDSSRTPDPEEEYAQKVTWEREFHDELVNDGGRPWYPIHLLEEVSRNPREHRKILRAWQIYPDAQPDEWVVFGAQLGRWRLFREWQVKRRKEFEGRISEYTQWAKKFLLKHSFARPFEFGEDSMQQDKLTTWIEYMTYEYNFYATRYAWYERREKWYNKKLRKLMDSGVLKPHETEQFVLDLPPLYYGEVPQAEKAVESARLAVSSAQETIRDPAQPSSAARRRLEAAQSKLESANQSFESTKRRHDLISKFHEDTFNYRFVKGQAERHVILLQWIREQVLLVETESKQDKIAGTSSDANHGSGRASEAREDQSTERQKPYDEERSLSTQGTATNPQRPRLKRQLGDISTDDESPSKRSKYDVHDSVIGSKESRIPTARKQDGLEKATSQTSMLPHTRSADVPQSSEITQPRRSARIAEREKSSKAAVTPPSAVKSPRQRSRRNIAQAPTPSSSIVSQHCQSRLKATKAVHRGGTKRGGRRKVSRRENTS